MLVKSLKKTGIQSLVNHSTASYNKVLQDSTIADEVKKAEYAVRGAIPARGQELQSLLDNGQKLSFDSTSPCNIGNPQSVGQGHITYNREVLSALIHPALLHTDALSEDAKARAEQLLMDLKSPLGAYTSNSKGYDIVRKHVCDFIERRDGEAVKCDPNDIYLTNGASEGVRIAMKLLIRDKSDGILVPIPQYPLYSALINLSGGTMVRYYLNEDKNWGVTTHDLLNSIKEAKEKKIKVRCIVVINPGNPTGQVLAREDIERIIKIAHEESILIMADEVYQENIYGRQPFISFRKVLAEMGAPYANQVELFSCHSVSKGLGGECGLRGGYCETHNLSEFAKDQFYKLKSIELCSNTVGMAATDLMVNSPRRGRESDICIDLYETELQRVFNGLKERAQLLTKQFNNMTNTSCTQIDGAMYGFPQLHMSEKALKTATQKGVKPDFMYCMDLVEQTGIMTVPGSGFEQKQGTYHLRFTNLITPTGSMKKVMTRLKDFNEKWQDKYQ